MKFAEYVIAVIAGLSMVALMAGLLWLTLLMEAPVILSMLVTALVTLALVMFFGLMRWAIRG